MTDNPYASPNDGPDWDYIASVLRVPVETLAFYYDALEAAPHYRDGEPGDIEDASHSRPEEFCEAFTKYAKQCLGPDFKSSQCRWVLQAVKT